jgi:transcriptional regulator with XRE-family HTH domain
MTMSAPLYLGKSIRVLRARAGLTQSEVARRIGIHNSVTSLWEQDKRNIPFERVSELARALEVTEEELLDNHADEYRRLMEMRLATPEGDVSLLDRVVIVADDPKLEPPPPPPDERLWCECGGRRHYHGVRPSWAPFVMAIKDLV